MSNVSTRQLCQLQPGLTAYDFMLSDGLYRVVFGGGDYLLLDVGFELTKPLAHEANPNALAKRDKKFEFKHSAPNGAKWWTSSLGVTFLFAIPKENIQIVADTCGYSYPKIVINEQTITLNTSGGTIDGGGWGDFVGDAASTLINLCREEFLAIAETGVVNDHTQSLAAAYLAAHSQG